MYSGELRWKKMFMSIYQRGCSGSNTAVARFDFLLLDLGVLDHVDAVSRAELAFNGDRLGGILRQFGVKRLVLTDQQIRLAVICFDSDRQAGVDALLRAVGVLLARRVVIEVASHVEHLAFDCDFLFIFANSLLALVLMTFVGNDRRCRE